jgi:hypothetical protein
VWSLIELKNGELISGGSDGSLRRWRDGKPVGDGKPIATGQGGVASLIELKNGELISGGSDGSLRRWALKPTVIAICRSSDLGSGSYPDAMQPAREAALRSCRRVGVAKGN